MSIEAPVRCARRRPVSTPRDRVGARVGGIWLGGLASLLLIAALGCAAGSGPMTVETSERTLAPKGPGHVFATAEEAALDALAYCHLASRRSERDGLVARAGTVRAVAGGFRYEEPVSAAIGQGPLRYVLGREDVLHYRHYPRWGNAGSGPTSSALSTRDRRMVDRRDPLARPIYFMTPGREVRVYAGRAGERRALGRVGPGVGPRDEAIRISLRVPPAEGGPLAHQPAAHSPFGR